MLVTAVALVLAAGLPRPPRLNPSGVPFLPAIATRVPDRPVPSAKPAQTLPFSMRDVVVFLSGNGGEGTEASFEFAPDSPRG